MEDIKKEVENIASAYVGSFNRQDAAGIAALYASGGIHINPAGPRTDIEKYYQALFAAGFDYQEASVDEAYLLGSDAAIAVGQYRIAGKNQSGFARNMRAFLPRPMYVRAANGKSECRRLFRNHRRPRNRMCNPGYNWPLLCSKPNLQVDVADGS